MELILWKYRGQNGYLSLPMLKSKSLGKLTSSSGLCSALQLSAVNLRSITDRNRDWLEPLSVAFCNAKGREPEISAFVRLHRNTLGIERVRGDALLWPLRECLKVAFIAKTPAARDLHEGLIDHMEREAEELRLEVQQYKALLSQSDGPLAERRVELHLIN